MSVNKPPSIIYKYRTFDARSISMLANNQIYFSSPLQFNDPFDCLAQEKIFDYFSNDDIEKFALSQGVLKDDLTPEKADLMRKLLNDHPEVKAIQEKHKHLLRQDLEKRGVLSLTECNDSILMWSHYANYHKGFCIGFKNNLGLNENEINKINYVVNVPSLHAQHIMLSSMSKEQQEIYIVALNFLTKYVDWHYEKEWRIMGDVGIALYDDECIDSIIFGLKMPSEDRNTIRAILKNKKIRYFRAVKSETVFKLDIVPC